MREKTDQKDIIERDITPVFKAAGIPATQAILVEELQGITYPAKEDVWANWFTYAFVAFKNLKEKLNKENKKAASFVTVGTGPGIDAVGAMKIFDNLNSVIATDIDANALPVAEINIKKFSTDNMRIQVLDGNLFEPLKRLGEKFDIIYENLPNIPDTENIIEGIRSSSVFEKDSIKLNTDAVDVGAIKKYLLETHLASLIEAKNVLNDGGSLILSIGGRVPYDLLGTMVTRTGYTFENLVSGVKIQTEPREVLPGYAQAEKESGVEFDFYLLSEVKENIKDKGEFPFLTTDGKKLKEDISKYRVSATKANELYQSDNTIEIGHVVHMLRAIKQ